MAEIYLDNNTLSRPHPFAVDKLKELYEKGWLQTDFASHPACRRLYDAFGAGKMDRFYFSSLRDEAMERFLFAYYLDEIKKTGRNHFLQLATEKKPLFEKFESLGCAVKTLPVNANGQMTREILENFLRPRVGFLSIDWANPLTGVIQPIEDIALLCKEKNIFLHVDGSAVFGKIYFRFEDLNIDCLTFDSQLFHGLEGTGGMFLKQASRLPSLIYSDPPFPLAASLALAADEAAHYFDHLCTETARLRDRLESGILETCGEAKILCTEVDRLPNSTVAAFSGVSSEALLFLLKRKGIRATRGGGDLPLLAAILNECGIDPVFAEGSLTFSLSRETTEEEIDQAILDIAECYNKLRQHSMGIL